MKHLLQSALGGFYIRGHGMTTEPVRGEAGEPPSREECEWVCTAWGD